MSNHFVWQGRTDHEEVGDTNRWHHVVKSFDEKSRDGVVLIGYAVDEGVRRNGGRVGAAGGPSALRAALANTPLHGEPTLWDAGDVTCHGDALEEAQEVLATSVAAALHRNSRPLVLGGGHDMAWGTFQGIVRARPELERLLIVNIDAHFDLRVATQANSGTPFRQMAEWCAAHGRPFDYHVLGISTFGNTRALFDRAASLGVHHTLDEALQDNLLTSQAILALQRALAHCDGVYLTICLDVLPAHIAPGVSAPSSLGVPLQCAERIIDSVLASRKLVASDIAELNPSLDEGGRTARAAARLAARVARG